MKSRHPALPALRILGWTFGAVLAVTVALFTAMMLATPGGSEESWWGFTLYIVMVVPIALLIGVAWAVVRCLKDFRQRRESDVSPVPPRVPNDAHHQEE